MALKKCKECGREISSKAKVCPICGAPCKKNVGCGCLAVLLIIFGVFVLFAVVVTQFANSPEGKAARDQQAAQDEADKKSQAVRDAQAAKAANDAHAKLLNDAPTFSADQVVKYYSDNEVAGDQALKGKVFKVQGVIERVGKDMLGSSFVVFKSNATTIRSVQCFFDDSHLSELSTLQPGQNVVIFGTCDGLMMNVLMKNCEIVK